MEMVILASTNSGKISEIRQLLQDLSLSIIPQSEFNIEEAEETGETFVENALIKARHVCQLTNKPTIADDSGLVVPSLGGAPGVYSARYAGKGAKDADLICKLLGAMEHKEGAERAASFHSVVVFMRYAKDPAPIIVHGIWYGSILYTPKGQYGFGYDPIFYVPSHQCSAAELPINEKNPISHRGLAMAELKRKLALQQIS